MVYAAIFHPSRSPSNVSRVSRPSPILPLKKGMSICLLFEKGEEQKMEMEAKKRGDMLRRDREHFDETTETSNHSKFLVFL